MAKNKTDKKRTKPKGFAGKKGKPLKKTAKKNLAKKRETPKKKSALKKAGVKTKALGQKIELNQRSYIIVGVMPRKTQYPTVAEVFLPFAPSPAQLDDRSSRDYLVVGRLRHGVTKSDAQAELNLIAGHLAETYPATDRNWSVKVETMLADLNGDRAPLFFSMIQGATFFVLLVVCANVANLQFARGMARRPEIAMRTALGAGRSRLLRQLLTENLLLGLIGGAGGLAVGTRSDGHFKILEVIQITDSIIKYVYRAMVLKGHENCQQPAR